MVHTGYCPNCKIRTSQDNQSQGDKHGDKHGDYFICRNCGHLLYERSDGRVIDNGRPDSMIPAATKMYEDGEAGGVSVPTLKRACTQIGVLKFKMQDEGWVWQHPSDMTPIPESARNLNPLAMERKARERAVLKGSTPEPAESELDFFAPTKMQVE